MDVLYYSGFSRERVANLWKKRLEGENVKKVIDAIIQAEGYKYSEIQALVKDRCAVKPDQGEALGEDVLVAAIQFVLKMPTEQKDPNSWFFAGRDSDVCIGAMTKLSDEEIKRFIAQCKTEEEYNIYQECWLKGGMIVHHNGWNREMAKVYAWGVHPKKRESNEVMTKEGTVLFADFDQ